MKLLIKPLTAAVAQHYDQWNSHHEGDAGLDVVFPETVVVPPKAIGLKIGLGIQCEPLGTPITLCIEGNPPKEMNRIPPAAYELWPRSSIGKTPIRLANSIGLIDPSYRGEIMVMVDNLSDQPFTLEKGTRLFQLVSADRRPIEVEVVEKLSETSRGSGGHGSTGA